MVTMTDYDEMVEQRQHALERANETRTQLMLLKAEIKHAGRIEGAALAAEVIDAGEQPIPFDRLLMAIPLVGRTKTIRMLRDAGISPWRKVSDEMVTKAQRGRLIYMLLTRGRLG